MSKLKVDTAVELIGERVKSSEAFEGEPFSKASNCGQFLRTCRGGYSSDIVRSLRPSTRTL